MSNQDPFAELDGLIDLLDSLGEPGAFGLEEVLVPKPEPPRPSEARDFSLTPKPNLEAEKEAYLESTSDISDAALESEQPAQEAITQEVEAQEIEEEKSDLDMAGVDETSGQHGPDSLDSKMAAYEYTEPLSVSDEAQEIAETFTESSEPFYPKEGLSIVESELETESWAQKTEVGSEVERDADTGQEEPNRGDDLVQYLEEAPSLQEEPEISEPSPLMVEPENSATDLGVAPPLWVDFSEPAKQEIQKPAENLPPLALPEIIEPLEVPGNIPISPAVPEVSAQKTENSLPIKPVWSLPEVGAAPLSEKAAPLTPAESRQAVESEVEKPTPGLKEEQPPLAVAAIEIDLANEDMQSYFEEALELPAPGEVDHLSDRTLKTRSQKIAEAEKEKVASEEVAEAGVPQISEEEVSAEKGKAIVMHSKARRKKAKGGRVEVGNAPDALHMGVKVLGTVPSTKKQNWVTNKLQLLLEPDESGRAKWRGLLIDAFWVIIVASAVAFGASRLVPKYFVKPEVAPPSQQGPKSIKTSITPGGEVQTASVLLQDWADSLEVPAEILNGAAVDMPYIAKGGTKEPQWPGRSSNSGASNGDANAGFAPIMVQRVSGQAVKLFTLGFGKNQEKINGLWSIPVACASRISATNGTGSETTSGSSWVYALAVPEADCRQAARRMVARTLPSFGDRTKLTEAAARAEGGLIPRGVHFLPGDLKDVAIAKIGNERYAWGVFRAPLKTTQMVPAPPLPQVAFVASLKNGEWEISWTDYVSSSKELLALVGVFDVDGQGVPQAFYAKRGDAGKQSVMRIGQNPEGKWALTDTRPL